MNEGRIDKLKCKLTNFKLGGSMKYVGYVRKVSRTSINRKY